LKTGDDEDFPAKLEGEVGTGEDFFTAKTRRREVWDEVGKILFFFNLRALASWRLGGGKFSQPRMSRNATEDEASVKLRALVSWR
jgi:hypothetical protein